MHRNKIIIKTERGVILNGVLWTNGTSDTVLINITGIHGNFFTNFFYCNVGDKLVSENIDFIYAETCDAFPRLETYDVSKNEIAHIGSYNERFSYTNDDVGSYVKKVKELGYKHIYISGHSLGANKVIHYLSNFPNDIEHFLLISPADTGHLTRKVSTDEKRQVSELIKSGRGSEECPFKVMGWLECINYTANDWINDNILNNVFSTGNIDCDKSQISKIGIDGAFIAGELDVFGQDNVRNFIENLNDIMQCKNKNQIYIIEGANHLYKGKENELSESVLEIVKKWQS